jgi:triosephosphate isomerase
MRSKFVAGNWKMNGSLEANGSLLDALVAGLGGVATGRVVVMAPFPYLGQCSGRLGGTPIGWGAQDVSAHEPGAYTGEVSASMLAEFGCSHVIVGHSERRALHAETDETVVAKAIAAVRGGLTPVICVGETLAQREGGETESVIARQVDAVMDGAGVDVLKAAILAYEPVWAIGTGRTATPEQAQEVHAFIRGRVARMDGGCAESLRILYGGSVKAANAQSLFAMADVDGGLVGGASLVPTEFLGICRAAFGLPG